MDYTCAQVTSNDEEILKSERQLSSKVPKGRVSRFLQLGATAGRMAAGGLAEKAKRLGQGAQDRVGDLPHALLTASNAKLLAARLARLRGAAMKVGQMLSLEGDNALPPEFAQALEVLRSSAHSMPRQQVEQVLRKELGSDYLRRFAEFDHEPMAAASIGQVHRAVLLDGTEVVLKIQYPGVAESIDSDVDNLRSLLSFARLLPGDLNLDEFTAEVKAELHREVDYVRELAQSNLYREALGTVDGIFVPRMYPEHSTSRVLTMELAPGVELLKWSKGASQEQRNHVAAQLNSLLQRELFLMGRMQTDPNPANYLYDEKSAQLVLLDFGAAREVPDQIADLYRRALRGIALKDEALLMEVIRELDVEVQPGKVAPKIIEIAMLASEIFEQPEYDFAASTLTAKLHEAGKKMAVHQKDVKPPPPEYVFFQRKLGGTFLLCRQLKAKVACRAQLVEYGVIAE